MVWRHAELGERTDGLIVKLRRPLVRIEHGHVFLDEKRVPGDRKLLSPGEDTHLKGDGCCRGGDKQVHTALSVEQQTGSKGAIHQHHSERKTVNASDFSDPGKGNVIDLGAAERKPGDASNAVTEIFNG